MPTYKTRRVLRDLESKCEVVPNNNGSHQKFRNPITGQTTTVPAHFRRDLSERFEGSFLSYVCFDKEKYDATKNSPVKTAG